MERIPTSSLEKGGIPGETESLERQGAEFGVEKNPPAKLPEAKLPEAEKTVGETGEESRQVQEQAGKAEEEQIIGLAGEMEKLQLAFEADKTNIELAKKLGWKKEELKETIKNFGGVDSRALEKIKQEIREQIAKREMIKKMLNDTKQGSFQEGLKEWENDISEGQKLLQDRLRFQQWLQKRFERVLDNMEEMGGKINQANLERAIFFKKALNALG